MAYPRWRLDFDDVLTRETRSVALPSGNDEMNPWILGERGWSERKLPRPQLEMQRHVLLEVRGKLRTLDLERPAGWVQDSLEILDWNQAESPRTPRIKH
jgi:hypothetical protein